MKFESIGDKQNQAKLVQEILSKYVSGHMNELEDGYGIPYEVIEKLTVGIYVNNNNKVLWKAGKTKFVKTFEKEVSRLVKSAITSFEEMGLLTYLASEYTSHEDNYLKKDGEYLTKKELINNLHNDTKDHSKSSISYYKKIILELEKKNLILSEPHPKDKRNKVFYLSPYLFYRGKYIDSYAKGKLLEIVKTVHKEIKKLNDEGKINIPIDNSFEDKDDDKLIEDFLELLNEAS
jgi:hypothetical protein